jgi:hypothetical protein
VEAEAITNNLLQRQPFQKHKIYYPALKVAIFAQADYLAARFFGVL